MTTATAKKKAPAKGDPKAEPVNKDRAKVRQATALRGAIARQSEVIAEIKHVLKEAKDHREFLVRGLLDVFEPDPSMPLFDGPAKDEWRSRLLTPLELDQRTSECLVAAAIVTVGDIVDHMDSGRSLEDIPNVTPAMAREITKAIEYFHEEREAAGTSKAR